MSPSRSSRAVQPTAPKRRRLRTVLIALGVAVAAALVLTAAGFGFAATQEQRDPFCASCHTQPESTFYSRESAAASDLASAHHVKGVGCIGCHSGAGLNGRVRAELLGAHNALAWYTGTAVQPAKLTQPIPDENCIKCHAQISEARTMQNHFHFFLPQWQARDPNAAKCVSCHEGHMTDGRADIKFLNEQRTVAVCQACHNQLGGGD